MRRRASSIVPLILLLAVMVCTTGCHRTLFPANAPRTQYEKYNLMHNRYTPTEEPDVFGNPQPALRARLSSRR